MQTRYKERTIRIAIIRGRSPNLSEYQAHAAFAERHTITVFAAFDPRQGAEVYQSSGSLAFEPLPSLDSQFPLPHGWKPYLQFAFDQVIGLHTPYIHLEQAIKDYDILNVADTIAYHCYQAAKIKAKYGMKLVVTAWETIPYRYRRGWLGDRINSAVREATDLYLAMTRRAKETLLLEGVPEDRIVLTPPGMNVELFTPAEKDTDLLKTLHLPEDAQIVLFIGRMVWSKGIDDLLYAAKRLAPRWPKLRLLLVGGGLELSRVQGTIQHLGLQQIVRTTGSVPFERMPTIHNLADISVLPSIPKRYWQEQFGLALVESMACGKSVIGTFGGAMPEVIGSAGILVPPGDFLALSEAIETLLADPSCREHIGRCARQRVEERFNASVNGKRLEAIYKSL